MYVINACFGYRILKFTAVDCYLAKKHMVFCKCISSFFEDVFYGNRQGKVV